MKSVRLLPVVIFAAVALLTFKTVGIFTNGGYVLLGTEPAMAAGGGGGSASTAHDAMAAMVEPTLTDVAPTAADGAPTLPLGEQAPGGHGAAVASDHTAGGETEVHSEAPMQASALPDACAPSDAALNAQGETTSVEQGLPCDPALLGPDGDAVPMVQSADGSLVPFDSDTGNEAVLLERLGERRNTLDAREQELELRMALVEAAERRVNERTALLEQLEARIDALVEQNKAAEEGQFKAIVSMYETMKPKEAAVIFDELDMNTLLRVAQSMNPRKMAPILAKMSPVRAKDLTAAMAVAPVEPTIAVTEDDIAALPQIVGQ